MRIHGDQLREILRSQTEPVNVLNGAGEGCGFVEPAKALLLLNEREYIGVGNRHRGIRMMQPTQSRRWIAGGCSTRRAMTDDGRYVGSPITTQEHVPLRRGLL